MENAFVLGIFVIVAVWGGAGIIGAMVSRSVDRLSEQLEGVGDFGCVKSAIHDVASSIRNVRDEMQTARQVKRKK
jgi:hypothetical protein